MESGVNRHEGLQQNLQLVVTVCRLFEPWHTLNLRGEALARRVAGVDDERDGTSVELPRQLGGRAVLEHEVNDGNVSCIGLEPGSRLNQGAHARYSNASFLQVGFDRQGDKGLILDNQAAGLICDGSAHDLFARGGQARQHSLKLVRASPCPWQKGYSAPVVDGTSATCGVAIWPMTLVIISAR
jgi:hypothetical protein